jgi:hypothetical protein
VKQVQLQDCRDKDGNEQINRNWIKLVCKSQLSNCEIKLRHEKREHLSCDRALKSGSLAKGRVSRPLSNGRVTSDEDFEELERAKSEVIECTKSKKRLQISAKKQIQKREDQLIKCRKDATS